MQTKSSSTSAPKPKAVISSKELGLRGETDHLGLEPGDQIKVFVLQPENDEGNVVLSLRRAPRRDHLVGRGREADRRFGHRGRRPGAEQGRAHRERPGSARIPAFEPGRASLRGSLESLVGQRIPVKILEVNRKRNRLIVSQKAAEDEDRARKREELFRPASDGRQP